jgi:YD repeat-containing protein
MSKVTYVRDGQNQIIGSTTRGLANGDTVVRDREGHIVGHANDVFRNTRDAQGRLISRNSSDPGLLIRKK